MSIQLVGITDEATARRVELNRAEPDLAGVTLIEACGLAAIAVPSSRPRWLRNRSRLKLIEKLTAEQKRLEALIKLGPLLPAAGDARLSDAGEIRSFLVASADGLREELGAYGALVQFQVVIEWDAERFAQRTLPAGALACSPGVPAVDPATSIEDSRKQLAETAFAWISERAKGCLNMPRGNERVVANLVVLIGKSEEDQLDAALARIDAVAPDALTLRVTGPLPPLSFASVTVDVPSEPSIRAARKLLGIHAEASTEAVRQAYLRNVKVAHPDSAGGSLLSGDVPDMAGIKTAYDLLMRIHAMQSRHGKVAPFALIRREGDVTRAI
jgi:hypothetical protein